MADRAAAILSQPSQRPCDCARLWAGIPGRDRTRPAAGVLARRHRVSRRRRSHVRGLSAGRALLDRELLVPVSARAHRRRRPTGGACGAVDHDGHGLQLARPRIRSAGVGAAAVGDAALALLAVDRPGPAQRLVRLVDRGRIVAVDHLVRDSAVGFGRGLCACDRTGTAPAVVVRSVVRAVGDRRAGAALSDLSDPRRHPRIAVFARRSPSWAHGRCIWLGWSAACCWRCRGS